jgi:hypothetical protein
MQYELKISGAQTDDGAIDLDRHGETVEQQLERQLQQKGNVNNLAALIGILADDDQTLEDDLMLLTK